MVFLLIFHGLMSSTFAAEPTYKWIRENILVPNCIQCHGGGGPKDRKIYFETYEGVLKEVVPGDPDMSPLYLSLLPGGTADLMPLDGTEEPLPEESLEAVRNWILDGAPQ